MNKGRFFSLYPEDISKTVVFVIGCEAVIVLCMIFDPFSLFLMVFLLSLLLFSETSDLCRK